jgi:hypothetical protein
MEHPTTKVTVLPPAGREAQMERWGIGPGRTGDHLNGGDRRGQLADDALPIGDEHGETEDRELEERGFLLDGGWHAVTVTEGGGRSGGMTSHRGVLQGHEHVDSDALRALVENELGFTYDQVHAVYRQGPLSPERRWLRGRIDARLLELARAGGNVALLGSALGFPVKANGNVRAMENALARAREEARQC